MASTSENLQVTQTRKHYKLQSTGDRIVVRTIEPSLPSGGWPGNKATIRAWEICPFGQISYRRCTREEVIKFEKLADEWKQIRFVNHPTLGEVCEEDK